MQNYLEVGNPDTWILTREAIKLLTYKDKHGTIRHYSISRLRNLMYIGKIRYRVINRKLYKVSLRDVLNFKKVLDAKYPGSPPVEYGREE